MRILKCKMLDFLDVHKFYHQICPPVSNVEPIKSQDNTPASASIVTLFTTCQDTAMSCQLSEVGRLKRLFTCMMRRRLASCSSFKHFITCIASWKFFYPGTLEMFQMFGKHWIIFSTSCVMVWHILYLELKLCQCYTYN